MFSVYENKITVDGIKRLINYDELFKFSREYLPSDMSNNDKDAFVKEVVYRMSSLEIDSSVFNKRSAEEYFFAACLTYVKENGFTAFFEEEDDTKIFDYCGVELD